MAYFEAAYAPLIQGVSQQTPKDRQPGQVSEQINMSSDIAFGIRRRPGSSFKHAYSWLWESSRISTYQADLSGVRVLFVVDTKDGSCTLLGNDGNVLSKLQQDYLRAESGTRIQFATANDAVYVVNTAVVPTEEKASVATQYPDPSRSGYAYVVASAFGKEYTVTVSTPGDSFTASYTTPNGSGEGDASKATTDHVTTEMYNQLVGHFGDGWDIRQKGGYLGVVGPVGTTMSVSTSAGATYMKASGASHVSQVQDLPSTLPQHLDNYIVAVGTGRSSTYYRWQDSTQSWLEDASYPDLTELRNMPLKLSYTDAEWKLTEVDWERRTSGDKDNNPSPHFIEAGLITGMAAFQGRLVILSNEYVCMSASNRPERWYRSTVESLDNSDPIEVAGQDSLSSPYQRGVVFNKDLVLFSRGYQAVVPGSAAVTPNNATVAVVSQYEAQSNVTPASTGRSLLFAAPRIQGYSALWEATPSPYIDSSIVGQDVTDHIPTYIPSTCRFIRASSTTSMAVVGLENDLRTLLVHEFLWNGDSKVQSAWHKWVFDFDVVECQFVRDVLVLLVNADTGGTKWLELDIRQGSGEVSSSYPRMDGLAEVTCKKQDTLELQSDHRAVLGELPVAFKMQGEFPYLPAGVTVRGDGSYEVLGAVPGDVYLVGRLYQSSVELTPPVLYDSNKTAVVNARTLVHKYMVGFQNTGEFQYSVGDKYRDAKVMSWSAMRYASPEMGAGKPQVADDVAIIPARTDMDSTRLILSTRTVYDMNITSVEYGFKYNRRYGRRQ